MLIILSSSKNFLSATTNIRVSAIPNPTIVWGWVYATVGGRKKVIVGICEFCKVEWFEFDERHCCDEALADKPTVLLDMKACSECGANFLGAGFPIGREGCWISNPNCGNCYGYVDGVYQG
jgi:hypothetical protein